MEFGVLLPTEAGVTGGVHDVGLISKMAQDAEALGYHSLWTGDRPLLTKRLEPLVTLGFAASKTERMRLGTAVLVAPLRNPVELAQATASLDVLSGGRMILGLGVGAAKSIPEYESARIPYHSRGKIFNDCICILKKLWSEDRVNFEGDYYSLKDASLKLKPVQTDGPPVLIGGFNEEAFKRAATLADGWFPSEISLENFEHGVKKTNNFAKEAGRNLSSICYSIYITINLNTDEMKARDQAREFLSRYYNSEVKSVENAGYFGSSTGCISALEKYSKAGASRMVVRFGSFAPLEQLRIFAKEVLPSF